jgi:hypothetical protein
MRFIITAGPAEDSKPHGDVPQSDELIAAYMKFNEDMHNAGVLVAAEGLAPGARGARIGVSGGKRKVMDGPFAESKELVGGFYVIEVPSLDEAKAWALRCPTGLGFDDVLETRQLTGSADVPKGMLELTARVAPNWSATWMKK